MKNYSRLIQKYAQVMLPPPPGMPIEMPLFPASRTPDVEGIENDALKRVEEIEAAKEESAEAARLKQEHIDEMLKALEDDNFFQLDGDKEVVASRSADKILKLCSNYYRLCFK